MRVQRDERQAFFWQAFFGRLFHGGLSCEAVRLKLRVLVLGSGHFVAARVLQALSASDWAAPVPFSGPPASLSEADLAGIDSVFNGTMGRPDAIVSHAQASTGFWNAAAAGCARCT